VFQNLIGNALKYACDRKPVIDIESYANGTEWIFSIHDNGIGIKEDDLVRIFNPFERSEDAYKKYIPGTGIGLAICKKVVELHHGRIWATSTPGHGSTFYFSLPKK
jgi:signal transduction histidine kinase